MMARRHHTLLFIALLLPALALAGTIHVDTGFYTAPGDATLPSGLEGPVRHVILMIGDGMGLNEISAAQYTAVGPEGKLHLQTLPITGLMSTYSASDLITDSAASGTALATGYKTKNGMIGMLPDGSEPTSILTAAQTAGMATGLVATSGITHATPAVFAAHNEYRYNSFEIALDMADSGVDVLFGGGWRHFRPAPLGERSDSLDLVERMIGRGYNYLTSKDELAELQTTPALGLFGPGPLMETVGTTDEPGWISEADSAQQAAMLDVVAGEPSIAEMTGKAIELLSRDDDGFFLMVEGSQIDWEGHANEEDELVRRLLLFDMAVARAIEFAREDGETLVIVTADHETGGMTLTKGRRDGSSVLAQFASPSHTAGPVPLFAFGPGAEQFTGMLDNTDVPVILANALGLTGFPTPLDALNAQVDTE